jgi:hypothetical protein
MWFRHVYVVLGTFLVTRQGYRLNDLNLRDFFDLLHEDTITSNYIVIQGVYR